MSRWQDRDPVPYPPPVPGEKARMLPDPVDPPDPAADPLIVTLPDGTQRDLRKGFGLPAAAAASREDQVRWSGDVRSPTVADQGELLRDRGRRL